MSAKIQTNKSRKTIFLIGGAALLLIISFVLRNMSDSLGEDRASEELIISGQKKNKKADYKGAIKDFTEAINISPKKYKAYGGRALAYDKLEQYDMALSDYKKSLKYCNSKRDKSFLHVEIGKLEYRFENDDVACNHFKKSADMGDEKGAHYYSKICLEEPLDDGTLAPDHSHSEAASDTTSLGHD
jgi:tetratricopeptide (TPR) repeat protein